MEAFRSTLTQGAGIPYSKHDAALVLRLLQHQHHVSIATKHGVPCIKVRASTERAATPVTDVDHGIQEMQRTITKLQAQCTLLVGKIALAQEGARRSLAQQQRPFALHALRQAKAYQALLDKRLASQFSLETILGRIAQAETESTILVAYASGTSALQGMLADAGMTVERVEETMDAVQDVLADQAEMDEAFGVGHAAIADLAAGPEGAEAVDAEMERELDALLLASRVEEVDAAFPAVPMTALPAAELVAQASTTGISVVPGTRKERAGATPLLP
jgi:charged multivesicular body protein 7